MLRVAVIFLLLPIQFWVSSTADAQTPCVNGTVLDLYPCENVELLSHLPNSQFDGLVTSDIWGWTDSLDGSEYVLLCQYSGIWFIDVTQPMSPIVLGSMPTSGSGSGSTWRDVKVVGNKAYVVTELPQSGLQVFDLTRLRDVTNPPEILSQNSQIGGFSHAHNLVAHEPSQTLYVCGASNQPGLIIYQHHDDGLPQLLGSYNESGYIHDAQVVVYQGPDSAHVGKRLAFTANENYIAILDVDDPSDVSLLATAAPDVIGFIHQGWLSADHAYFFVGDETDEINGLVDHTTTLIFDVQDLDNPVFIGSWSHEMAVSDHNMYTRGPWLYQSNYKAGFRMLDATGSADLMLDEVAYFDSYPTNNNAGFEGSWSNYPYFESGTIAIADMQQGLFLIRTTMLRVEPFFSSVCPLDTLEFTVTIDSALAGPITLDITPVPAWVSSPVLPGPGEWTIRVAGFPEPGTHGYRFRGIANGAPHAARVYVDLTNDIIHYPDLDGDGYGSYLGAVEGCGWGPGFVLVGGDCNDADPSIHPGQEDMCDGINNDCDPLTDEDGDAVVFYLDIDGDGHAGYLPYSACNYPSIWYGSGDDCDDLNPYIYPDAPASGQSVDNNCDGTIFGYEHEPGYCFQDIAPDGWVTIQDLLEILNQYGGQGMNTADFNFDLMVGVADILIMLTVFGDPCP